MYQQGGDFNLRALEDERRRVMECGINPLDHPKRQTP